MAAVVVVGATRIAPANNACYSSRWPGTRGAKRKNQRGLSLWRTRGVAGTKSINPSSRATLSTLRKVAISTLRVEA